MRGRVVRGLTIIVATDDTVRYRAALLLAAAHAASGRAARLYFNESAVLLLASATLDDSEIDNAGLPTLAELRGEALALGVRLIACQSGLALAGLDATMLDTRIEAGRMVGIVTSLGDDRLVFA